MYFFKQWGNEWPCWGLSAPHIWPQACWLYPSLSHLLPRHSSPAFSTFSTRPFPCSLLLHPLPMLGPSKIEFLLWLGVGKKCWNPSFWFSFGLVFLVWGSFVCLFVFWFWFFFLWNGILAHWSSYSQYIPCWTLHPFPLSQLCTAAQRCQWSCKNSLPQGFGLALKAPHWCQLPCSGDLCLLQLELAGTEAG